MAGRNGAQEGSHHFFGIDEQVGGGSLGAGDSVALADFAEALGSGLAGGDLSAKVAFAFFRRANVVEQEGQHIGDKFSAAHDLDGRDAEAFLVDFAAGAHGAGVSSTDIGVMGAGSDVEVGSGETAELLHPIAPKPGALGTPVRSAWTGGRLSPHRYTGITNVISGRWVPPRKGSLSMTTSPGSSSHCSTAAATDMGIDPKCTGM